MYIESAEVVEVGHSMPEIVSHVVSTRPKLLEAFQIWDKTEDIEGAKVVGR